MDSRRDFLKKAFGATLAVAAVPAVCELCNCGANAFAQGSPDTPFGTVMLNLGQPGFSKLATVGGSIVYTLPKPNNTIRLVITRKDAATFSVLTAICTHQGSIVHPYDSSLGLILCPTHGSEYSIDGAVLRGPSTTSLKSYSSTYNSASNILTITDSTITTASAAVSENDGLQCSLDQNYPNPFSGKTTIAFSISEAAHVSLIVTNALGSEIAVLANEMFSGGTHTVEFDASALGAGVYFYRLTAPNGVLVKQMIKN
ncbi:MAG TPA: T9SS type A sorting domain-containing protein [Candidatus Kapabacteria bacterium]|nr:T9SS type A sorting domain-containing protein [Candidatus Kapabacteria bacterium]